MKKRFMLFAMVLFSTVSSVYAQINLRDFFTTYYGATSSEVADLNSYPYTSIAASTPWQANADAWVYGIPAEPGISETALDQANFVSGAATADLIKYNDGTEVLVLDWAAYDAIYAAVIATRDGCAYGTIKTNLINKLKIYTNFPDPVTGVESPRKDIAIKELWCKAFNVSSNYSPRSYKSCWNQWQTGIAEDVKKLDRLNSLAKAVIDATDAIKAAQDLVDNGKIMADELQNVKDAIDDCRTLKNEFMTFENRAGDSEFTDAGTSTKYEDLLALAVKKMNDAVDASKTLEAYVDELVSWLKKELDLAAEAISGIVEPFKTNLQNAYDAAETVYNNIVANKYTETTPDAQVVTAASDLRKATTLQVTKATEDGEYLGNTYTLDVTPVRLGTSVETASASILNWTRYDAAVAKANDVITNGDLIPVAQTKLQAIVDGVDKDAVNTEWKAPAWDGSTYPTLTAPCNWSFNELVWNDAIDKLAQKVEAATVLAEALTEAKKAINKANNKITNEASAPGTVLLNNVEAKLTAELAQAQPLFDAYKNFDVLTPAAVKELTAEAAALKAIIDANDEEVKDVKAARNILKAQIALGEAVLADVDGIISATTQADLEKAIKQGKNAFLSGDVNNEIDLTKFAAAKGVTERAFNITAAIIAAQKELDGAYTLATGVDWAYTQPLALGTQKFDATDATVIYELDWAAYEAALAAVATDADALFTGTKPSDLKTAYTDLQTTAKAQWNTVVAFTGTTVAPYAANWKFNQEQWQKGIDVDAINIAAINNAVAAAKALNAQITTAEAIAATDILKNNTKIAEAITAAKAALAAVDLNNLDETSVLKLTEAENAIKTAVAANSEETEDVIAALAHLRETYKIAENALTELDGAAKTDLETAMGTAKAMIDALGDQTLPREFNTVKGAKDVMRAALELTKAIIAAENKFKASTADLAVAWEYSQPVRLGTVGDWTLTWTAYDAALDNLKLLSTDGDLKTALDAIIADYETKETTAKTQWESTQAWGTATNNLPKNWQMNQTLWNDQINMDAEQMKTILATAKALQDLSDAIADGNTQMTDPNKQAVLVGDIKTDLKDAIANGESTYNNYSSLSMCDAWTVADAQAATKAIKDALAANEEETNDVLAAVKVLRQSVLNAQDYIQYVENVDGGVQYKDELQAAIDKAVKYIENANAKKFNEAGYKIQNAKTLTDLAKELTKSVLAYKNQYNDGITPTTVAWILSTPLRFGEANVNTPATDPASAKTYDLIWTKYDFAVEELKDRAGKAVKDQNLMDLVKGTPTSIVEGLKATKSTIQDQWANVPAWTGTNFDKVNMYQYNETVWNLDLENAAVQIQKATAMVDAMGKLYDVITEAQAIADEDLLGDYKADFKTALKKASEKYDAYLNADKIAQATNNDINLIIKQAENLREAIDANAEEVNDVVAAKNLLHEAVDEAKFLQDKVEEPYKTTIGTLITEGETMLQNIADGKYNTLKATYNVTELIDKIVENALKAYDEYNKGITPIAVDWVFSTPLRLGEPNVNTPSTDPASATTYDLTWDEYKYALAELKDRTNKAVKDDALKTILKNDVDGIYDDYVALQTTAKDQWANVSAWTGTAFDKVNMWQYNQTIWNLDIENAAKNIKNITAMADAMGKLYDTLKEKEGLAAEDVLIDYKDALDKAYEKANEKYTAYATKEKMQKCTPNDIQLVKALTENLRHALDANYEEVNDVESTKPLLRQTIILVEEVVLPHIENGDNGTYLDNLTAAVAKAKAVWKLAQDKKYNELHDSYDLTKASRVLVRAYIDNMNAYQKEIRDLKDILAEEIKLANEALKEVNYTNMDTHMVNAETTELINQIAHSEGLVASMAKDESSVEDFNIDIANLKLAKKKLEKARINSYILDLYDFKNYIADANKFYNAFKDDPYTTEVTGLDAVMADMKTAIDAAQQVYDDAVKQNDPTDATHVKTTADYITWRQKIADNIVTLNKAHMAQNEEALKTSIAFIKQYLADNVGVLDDDVLDENTKGILEAIKQAQAAYDQYIGEVDNAEFYNSTRVQDIISDAIEAVLRETKQFIEHNKEQQAANAITRGKLVDKIAEAQDYLDGNTAVTAEGDFTIADVAKADLEAAITAAQAVADNTIATNQQLTDAITALDNAIKLAKVTSENFELNEAIAAAKAAQTALTDEDAQEILQATIAKAELMDKAMKNSDASINIYTTVTPEAVKNMIKSLGDATTEAQNYQEGDILGKVLADAAEYKTLIQSVYDAAVATRTSASPAAKKAAADNLKKAIDQAKKYVAQVNKLAELIADAKEAANPAATLELATIEAEEALAADENKFSLDDAELTTALNNLANAYNALYNELDPYRWKHTPTHPLLAPAPWKSNNTIAGNKVYVKLAGKYCSSDYETTNSAVDLFAQGTIDKDGAIHFDWKPFVAETDYKIDAVNLSGTGVADRNNWNSYEWSYNEHFNNVVIKAGTIYSSGDGYLKELKPYGPFTWDNVWNVSDVQLLDKDEDGNYYGRWYTYEWSEKDKGGVYYVPTTLSFYDWTTKKNIKDVQIVISQPESDGTYFINANLGEGFDTKTQNFVDGTYTLNGAWHQVQFIDADQFEYHKYAQQAADIYNYDKNGCYRHYTTASLAPLTRDIEAQTNDWAQNAADIEESLANFLADWNSIKMVANDDTKDINIDKQQFTYTVYGAKGDKLDIKLIPNTKKWLTKVDTKWQLVDVDELDAAVAEKYFQIVERPTEIGADGTATIKVEFDPAKVNVKDWREYQCRIDVIVGGVNYECPEKSSLQQVIVAHNPMMTFPRYRDDAMTMSYVTDYIKNAKPVFDDSKPAITTMKIDMPQEESDVFYFATLAYAGEQFGAAVPSVKSIVPAAINGEPGDEKLFTVDYITEIDRTSTTLEGNDLYIAQQINKAYGLNDINKEKGVIIKVYKSQITFTPDAKSQHLAAVDITITDGIRNNLVVTVNGAQQYIEWTTDIKNAIHQENDAKIVVKDNAIHFPTEGGVQTIGIKFDGFEGPCAGKPILSNLETADGTFKVQFVDSPDGWKSNDLTGTGIIYVDIVCEPSTTTDPHVKKDVVKFKVMNQEISINLTRTTPEISYYKDYYVEKEMFNTETNRPVLTIEGGENIDDYRKEFEFRVFDLINYYDVDDLAVWVDNDAFKVHEVARVHEGFAPGADDMDYLATVTILYRPLCSNTLNKTLLHIVNKKTLQKIDVELIGEKVSHANMMAVFGFDNGATSVEKAESEAEVKNGKFVEDGKVVIYRNGKKYTTAGQNLK